MSNLLATYQFLLQNIETNALLLYKVVSLER